MNGSHNIQKDAYFTYWTAAAAVEIPPKYGVPVDTSQALPSGTSSDGLVIVRIVGKPKAGTAPKMRERMGDDNVH